MVVVDTYIQSCHSLALKGGSRSYPFNHLVPFFFPRLEMGLPIYHALVLPECKQQGVSSNNLIWAEIRMSWASAQTFFTSVPRKKERRRNHQSFLHTQLPQPRASVAADVAVGVGWLLTQHCAPDPERRAVSERVL